MTRIANNEVGQTASARKSQHMKEQPLISLVTITFNASSELKPTMLSVKEQTFQDFEHLIIDGASTDDTLSVARRFGTDKLRILSEPDKGLYDAMNKGLAMAKGKYILFLNAGDTFHTSQTLEAYAKAAEKDPDIIYSDTEIVDRLRNRIGPRHLSVPDTLTLESFSHGMLICHQAFMVKRKLAPRYDLSYKFSADYEWTLQCILRTSPGRCVNLHMVGIDYLSDGLTDRNHMKSLLERFEIMRRHFGTATALKRHASFIPRAIMRKFND